MLLKNKYIIISLAIIMQALILNGCTDLEVEFENSKHIEQTDGEFEGVDVPEMLVTAYGRLNTIAGISYQGIPGIALVASDEMIIPTRATDWGNGGMHRVLHAHGWDAAHTEILSVWNNMHRGVYYTTQILASDPSPNQAAQAKALRGFYVYHLVDLFGQVAFREVTQGVDDYPRVMKRMEAFNFAVKDLEEAIPDLIDGGPTSDHTVVSKAFAYTLLARLYLNKAVYEATNPAGPYDFKSEDMNKVIGYCDQASGFGYSYEGNYFDNFSKRGGKELLLTFANWSPYHWIQVQLHNNQLGGWNGSTTLGSFYDKFELTEERIGYVPDKGIGRGFLIGIQYGDDGQPLKNKVGEPLNYTREIKLSGNPDYAGIRVLKYDPAILNEKVPCVVMRYSEIPLMKAEAILRGGTATKGETAQSIIDELRMARKASIISANIGMMLDERGREFYWEGIRRTDQIRFETFTKTTWEGKDLMDDHKVLFPIPQLAMDSNPNLEQNPGY